MMRNSGSASREDVGDVSAINEIETIDPKTLTALIARLERSHSPEHLVYREAELDEIWRLADGALRNARVSAAGAEETGLLEAFKDMIFKVHDLVGVDSDAQAAAGELRAGLFLALKYSNLRPDRD